MLDTLQLLLDDLSPALLAEDAIAPLQDAAARMSPIPRGGFEVRLSPDARDVDVQQCVFSDPRDRAALTAAPIFDAFLNAWKQPDLARDIGEVWFEHDCGEAAHAEMPSIFYALPPDLSAPDLRARVMFQGLDLLLGDDWHPWSDTLQRCHDACPEGVFVGFIGVMFSRRDEGVRVNVKRLTPDLLPGYLERIGWPGDHDRAVVEMTRIAAFADRITVCFDVGRQVAPTVAFEAIFAQQPPHPGVAEVLKDLVAQGLSSPEKADGVLSWCGETTPADRVWPDSLILRALREPRHRLGAFVRRMSHIKVALKPDQTREAKAYLWFDLEWRDLRPAQPAFPFNSWNGSEATGSHFEKIQAYFAATTRLYVEHLGHTFQGWLFDHAGDVASSNLALAGRAGLRQGDRVLDAGCGVCGPAIDIAQVWDTVQIEGITACPIQEEIALDLIAQDGLAKRVAVRCGDYHHLPWADAHFDRVWFLESSAHTNNPRRLFEEVWRVLRPGGVLYIKDVFRRPSSEVSVAEAQSLAVFDALFVDETRLLDETATLLHEIGFRDIACTDLGPRVDGARWREAISEVRGGKLEMTPFGRAHDAPFLEWPVICGEIYAVKPAPRS